MSNNALVALRAGAYDLHLVIAGSVRILFALLVLGGWAGAQEPPPDPTQGERSDGRIDADDHPAADALAVPRLLLAPVRGLVYALSFPVRGLADFVETHHVIQWAVDATTFSDGKRGIRPNFDYSSHYAPTAGLTYFDHKTLGPGSELKARFALGDARVMEGMLYARPTATGRRVQTDLRFDYLRRNDMYFDGIGPPETHRSRYAINAVTLWGGVHFRPTRLLAIDLEGETAWKHFAGGHETDGNLPIGAVFCVHIFGRCVTNIVDPKQVPGFDTGANYERAALALRLDTRAQSLPPRSGFLAGLRVDYSHGYGGDLSSYFRVFGLVGVAVNLWRGSHLLVLRVQGWMVEALNDIPVPFSELPVLGALDAMPGYHIGSIRDQSTLIATAEYRWPIWMYADASLFVDNGGAYVRNFSDFGSRARYWDVGLALRVRTDSHFLFRIGLAYGVEGGDFQFFVGGDAP